MWALTFRANVSSKMVAIRPPWMIPSCPHNARPRCRTAVANLSQEDPVIRASCRYRTHRLPLFRPSWPITTALPLACPVHAASQPLENYVPFEGHTLSTVLDPTKHQHIITPLDAPGGKGRSRFLDKGNSLVSYHLSPASFLSLALTLSLI